MKTNTLFMAIAILAMVFLWSCEKDIQTKSESEITFRGGMGGGGMGGTDIEPIYEVIYNGSIINSTETYGSEVTNNKKYELMQTDACGFFSIAGIPTLISCAASIDFCVDGSGLRQFDKKNLPGRVSMNIWFLDPAGNHNFTMFGWIQNGNTIFPESGSATIIFDKWSLSGPTSDTDGCRSDGDQFFGDISPGTPDASVIISRIENGQCPHSGDTCL